MVIEEINKKFLKRNVAKSFTAYPLYKCKAKGDIKLEQKQFNRLQLAADSGAIPYVTKEAERIAHLIPDFTSFEQECYQAIGRTLENLAENGREKKALIQRIIRETRHRFVKNRRSRDEIAIEAINEEGTVWEPEDTLASVEDAVLLKEKVALLAQDDERKKLILDTWTRGCTNDTEVSTLLAQRFGGNAPSHRKFIQRFRSNCQRELTA
ncbi:hypothetical protein BUN12_0076 [Bacillus amyloliquefaciens]|jgi:hypothetical protein|uniref:Uncharacterized protein n=2 Tax=Bacteria TaxID=2 RepID=A0A9P1NH03_BACAS|nr:hypothetical protein [Bacillus amyloliquefaciens]CBI42024.1 hypothetical protein predicted by Glimmer/Critica [Bacillus amyloliquefaciens DSM 7] [Bacillus amyloliquefaciens DSM 7 = ATCC 23350]AZV88340.1 hypothetical protein BUN12_0076 [Bacillus amyloliquefaciens]MEC1838064.1 hypothetical protein [Bacillus amyloliquefaciens]MEC2050579.1 hypothetical protein [Bacillus amyloliquefaciens]OXL22713.1 hypothetical protein CFI04_04860 [Bacillus amyloliquefaciens]